MPLGDDAGLDLGSAGIGALLFTVAELVRYVRRVVSVRGHDQGKFGLEEDIAGTADLAADTDTHLRSALVEGAKAQTEAGGLK